MIPLSRESDVLQLCGTLLLEWAKQHGAKISSSIQVQQSSSGGRGLYATQDIPANTELITIDPISLAIGHAAIGNGIRCRDAKHGQIVAVGIHN